VKPSQVSCECERAAIPCWECSQRASTERLERLELKYPSTSPKAVQLLDDLIGAFKTVESENLEDVDPEVLAMVFPVSEDA
jgi:hypothetical protein